MICLRFKRKNDAPTESGFIHIPQTGRIYRCHFALDTLSVQRMQMQIFNFSTEDQMCPTITEFPHIAWRKYFQQKEIPLRNFLGLWRQTTIGTATSFGLRFIEKRTAYTPSDQEMKYWYCWTRNGGKKNPTEPAPRETWDVAGRYRRSKSSCR